MKNIKTYILSALIAFSFSCSEELVSDKEEIKAPIVERFEPSSGRLGDEIKIFGENLGKVDSVYFGGKPVIVKYLVNGNELVAKITAEALPGVITVTNSAGSSSSTNDFTVLYPVPSITDAPATSIQRAIIPVKGKDLDVVLGVYFGEAEAEIIISEPEYMEVRVPYYDGVNGSGIPIVFTYNNAGIISKTESEADFILERVEPVVTHVPDYGDVSAPIVFEGEYMSIIEEVWFDDKQASILAQTESSITVSVSETQFPVTDENVTVKAVHSLGKELVMAENFKVDVSLIFYWPRTKIYTRAGSENHFMDLEKGKMYDACASFEDIIANSSIMANSSKQNYIQFRQTGNAGSGIKNYSCDGVKLASQNAEKDGKMYVLNPDIPEDLVFIDAIKAGTLLNFNPAEVAALNEGNSGSSNLNYYVTGKGTNAFEIGDVIRYKETYTDGSVKWGFIHVLDVLVDDELVGEQNDDPSYLEFEVYFQKY